MDGCVAFVKEPRSGLLQTIHQSLTIVDVSGRIGSDITHAAVAMEPTTVTKQHAIKKTKRVISSTRSNHLSSS